MTDIGIGIIGGGYMGKAHAVAMTVVGPVFGTALRPRLEMVAASSPESAERYRSGYGFARATADWRELVADPAVEAVIIASPQDTHHKIGLACAAAGKPVLCEKPLGQTLEESRSMVEAVEAAGVANMIGFNYPRTPATQFARKLIADGAIGDVYWVRCELSEDFFADPSLPANWRTRSPATGNMGDMAPHAINLAMALGGPIATLAGDIETVHKTRNGPDGPETVTNDDQAQFMVRFDSGAMGHIFASRVQQGRKMGYCYEVTGTKGAIRFDGEDQNALWLYESGSPAAFSGFRKILTGPAHPDFLPFCQGVGHGTGYQDQITIEARDFLTAIETGEPVWPTFRDGMEVDRVVEAVRRSHDRRQWVDIASV